MMVRRGVLIDMCIVTFVAYATSRPSFGILNKAPVDVPVFLLNFIIHIYMVPMFVPI
jgi:hypothetical protein